MVDLIVTVVAIVLAVLAVVSTGYLVFFPNEKTKPELWSPAKIAKVEAEVLFSDPRTWGEEVKPAKPIPPKGRGAASPSAPREPFALEVGSLRADIMERVRKRETARRHLETCPHDHEVIATFNNGEPVRTFCLKATQREVDKLQDEVAQLDLKLREYFYL